MFEEAQRLQNLPQYVFARLDSLKEKQRKKGVDLIDLGIGSPNIAPPKQITETMKKALDDHENDRYPSPFDGTHEFKESVTSWCKQQYNVTVDPQKEVAILIGSKEGLIHLALAFINPGDTTLVPSPAYPAHFNGTIIAGGIPHVLPTTEKTGFLPDLKTIDKSITQKAKFLILSYPTNPTAACATKEFFKEAIDFCKKNDIMLIHDFAYAELYFEGKKPPSALSIAGAKDVCIEFHTMSKTFGMAGWRIGFAVGNEKMIASLKRMKTNLDYGLFSSIQKAAIVGLKMSDGYFDEMRATYQRRRDLFIAGLEELGWKITKPCATFYLWIPVPKGYSSTDFSLHLMEKTGVVVAPGVAFGELGEGYVRIALVDKDERLKEALKRMKDSGIRYSNA